MATNKKRKNAWRTPPWMGDCTQFLMLGHERRSSAAYLSLSTDARGLLLACDNEAWEIERGHECRKPKVTMPDGEETVMAWTFTMNRWKIINKYKLFPDKSRRTTNAFKELVDKGFIELIASGKSSRTSNIYRMIGKWKTYDSSE